MTESKSRLAMLVLVLSMVLLFIVTSVSLWRLSEVRRQLKEVKQGMFEFQTSVSSRLAGIITTTAEIKKEQDELATTVRGIRGSLPQTPVNLDVLASQGIDFFVKKVIPDDPDLRNAMQRDPHFVAEGIREEAVPYYEAFLAKHPDSPYAYRVLQHIATLYSMWFNKTRGEKEDMAKARQYYLRSVDKAGGLLNEYVVDARVNSGACLATKDEIRKAYTEAYVWLVSLDSQRIKSNWGVTKNVAGKFANERDIQSILRANRDKAQVLTHNILGFAKHSSAPDKALQEVISQAKGTELADMAAQELATLDANKNK